MEVYTKKGRKGEHKGACPATGGCIYKAEVKGRSIELD